MVYNFSLPPLLLQALLKGSGKFLTKWAKQLEYPGEGCTYFNFTASHDGVGVRPLQGLLPKREFDGLIKEIKKRKGHVSMKRNSDGTESPYELNITYASALSEDADPKLGMERFLCSQAIALAMKGIPGVYIHSLMGTPNDYEGVKDSGIPRRINRKKYQRDELNTLIKGENENAEIFHRYLQMLRRRPNQPAFHPDAAQEIHDLGEQFFVIERTSTNGNQTIYCVFNLTGEPQQLTNPQSNDALRAAKKFYDILSGKTYSSGKKGITLAPYQALWLVAR